MKHAIFAVIALCACDRRLNPEFCLAHPDDVRCGLVDAPLPCVENADCPGQVCDVRSSSPACVDCTTNDTSQCPATAPVCSTENQCTGCATDDDCPGSVCLPDGSCPAEVDIIYAATTGATTTGCGARDLPCTIAQAVVEVTATRKIVKLIPNAGQDYVIAGNGGLGLNKDLTIAARGASFGRAGSGTVMTVSGGHTVTILGGVIKGGIGTTGHGITCIAASVLTVIDADIGPNEADGINDTGCGTFLQRVVIHNNDAGIQKVGGSVEVSRSTFQNNNAGGIDLSGTGTRFTIVNNVFWMNGVAGLAGGIKLVTDTSTTSRLEFNSFNANIASVGIGSALDCNVPGFTARNNVMFGNTDGINTEQVSGNCSHAYSIVSPGTVPAGAGNKADDPMFVSTTGNLRTAAGSPTEGAGDPGTMLTGLSAVDIDGEPRTAPPDIGIDQHP